MEDAYPVEGEPDGNVIRLTELERLDRDLFRNRFSECGRNDHLFGGQVLMQALGAASATVDGRVCHSLHAYFLRAGSASQRLIFKVERTRDGGRFATRRVVAEQDGAPVFHMESSFHTGEPGFDHQTPMPVTMPQPEDLPDLATFANDRADRGSSLILRSFDLIEMRMIEPERLFEPTFPARRRMWIRAPSAANSDDPLVHQQVLTYLSDYWLAGAALMPHPIRSPGPDLLTASLDHAMWFHRPCRADTWLLYDCDSPNAADGRGLSRGLLYDRSGALVASVVQEALFRRK